MTTAVTEAATQAAFKARYRTRLFVRFEAQKPGVKLRWTYVATKVVDGSVTSGKQFRDVYLDGITDKSWTEIGKADRDSWGAVYQAALRAADQALAAEKIAA